jgi:hypothetical protein
MKAVIIAHPDGTIEGLDEARAALLASPVSKACASSFARQCQKVTLAPASAPAAVPSPSTNAAKGSSPAPESSSTTAPSVKPRKTRNPKTSAPKTSTIPAALAA